MASRVKAYVWTDRQLPLGRLAQSIRSSLNNAQPMLQASSTSLFASSGDKRNARPYSSANLENVLFGINFANSSRSIGSWTKVRLDSKHRQVCGAVKAAVIVEHSDLESFFAIHFVGELYIFVVTDYSRVCTGCYLRLLSFVSLCNSRSSTSGGSRPDPIHHLLIGIVHLCYR